MKHFLSLIYEYVTINIGEYYMNNTENKKERKKLIILIILVSVLLASLIITFFVLMYKNNEKNTNSINASNENEENNNSINVNNDNEENNIKNPLLLDISFIKNNGINSIKDISNETTLIDNKLILINKLVYDINKKELVLDKNTYEDIKFVNNYFIVKKNNLYGIIDKNFKTVIPCEYDDIEIYSENCAFLSLHESHFTEIVNLKTKEKFGPYLFNYYFYDNIIIGDVYLGDRTELSSNLIQVSDDKLEEHIIDITNNTERKSNLKDFTWITAEKFQNNYIITAQNFKNGVIDLNLNEIIDFKYDKIKNIDDKFLLTKKNNEYQLIDINKNVILSFNYDNNIFDDDIFIENNIICLKLNDDLYYYDFKGNLLNTSNGDAFISSLNDDYYLIHDYINSTCKYIDLKNNQIKDLDYDEFCRWTDQINTGYLTKEDNDKYQLYNNVLNKVSDNYYDNIYLNDNCFIGKINDLYYVLDYNDNKLIEKTLIDFKYVEDSAYLLEDENNNLYYFQY